MATMTLKSPSATGSFTTTIPSPCTKSPHYGFTSFGMRPMPQYPRHYKHHQQHTHGGATVGIAGPSHTATSHEEDGPSPRKRARSEPPHFGGTFDDDVNMTDAQMTDEYFTAGGSNSSVKRSQSHLDLPSMGYTGFELFMGTEQCPPVQELSEPESQGSNWSQSQSQLRSASPAPTEVDDPEPEYLTNKLESYGIKIRDFAHETQPPPMMPTVRTVIPELFDQDESYVEYEYRMRQRNREYPLNPKILRRLLDVGWISMEEVQARAQTMDLVELEKFDSQPKHPYVLKYRTKQKPPTGKTLDYMVAAKRFQYNRIDRARRNDDIEAEMRERDARQVEESMERMRKGKGQAMEVGEKRKRIEDEWGFDEEELSQSLHPSQTAQQYPAPLSSYDPEIYPDAASVIESQQQSQGRPVPPPRVDTPPLEELEEQERRMREQQDDRPNALKKRGLKRTLSRTQTFTQL